MQTENVCCQLTTEKEYKKDCSVLYNSCSTHEGDELQEVELTFAHFRTETESCFDCVACM
jgi:hypothetical protein